MRDFAKKTFSCAMAAVLTVGLCPAFAFAAQDAPANASLVAAQAETEKSSDDSASTSKEKSTIDIDKAEVTVSPSYLAYTGTAKGAFDILKARQYIKPLRTPYTVKYSKTEDQKIEVGFTSISGSPVTFEPVSISHGRVRLSEKGVVTVRKNTRKGTYVLLVKVRAAEKGNYAAAARN